jgi:hypothetical protein
MDSFKCLHFYVCGKASAQVDIKEHSVGACSSVTCEAWRDIKGRNGGCLYGCDVYLAICTHRKHIDANWYGATSNTWRDAEDRNGYMKQIVGGWRKKFIIEK